MAKMANGGGGGTTTTNNSNNTYATTTTTTTTMTTASNHQNRLTEPMSVDRHTPSSIEEVFGIELAFGDLYSLTQRLRSGSFATVYVCKHNLSGVEFAVKVIDRKKLKPKDDASVFREVSVLRSLTGYAGVVNLIDFFVQPSTFHVILELARGGDVFDRLARRTVYTEKDARDLARNLLDIVRYVHSCGIVHRDLKPENLLLMDEINDTSIKLADFGFAKRYDPFSITGGLTTRCGTPAFVAPEILLGVPYDYKADMWSVGVILYLLLGGYPPFQHENHQGLFRKIRAADYVFHEKYWDEVSVEAKQLIAGLLTVDPKHRLDANRALKSAWILTDDESLSERSLSSSLTELKRFNARRKLKGAMHAVTWAVTATFWNADMVSFGSNIAAITGFGSSNATKKASNIKKGKTCRDIYDFKRKIRSGSFATIWEGVHRTTGVSYAIKVVNRKELKQKDDAAVLNEVAILQSLKYKHIVELVDFYEEKEYFFLVMELMNGGDVFDRIVERSHYTEKDARDLVRILLKAVDFMHRHGVAHRDLKPQNLLLKSKDDDSSIKVADFGFAKRVHTPQSLMTRCGTPTYVAPEVLKNHPHDCAVDMWSVGVIIYVLLVGYPPFMEDNQRTLFRKIRMGTYEFYEEDWADISQEAKDLIQGLLVVDPTHRMSAGEALRSPWIMGDDEMLSSRVLMGSLSELKKNLQISKTEPKAAQWLSCDCGVFT